MIFLILFLFSSPLWAQDFFCEFTQTRMTQYRGYHKENESHIFEDEVIKRFPPRIITTGKAISLSLVQETIKRVLIDQENFKRLQYTDTTQSVPAKIRIIPYQKSPLKKHHNLVFRVEEYNITQPQYTGVSGVVLAFNKEEMQSVTSGKTISPVYLLRSRCSIIGDDFAKITPQKDNQIYIFAREKKAISKLFPEYTSCPQTIDEQKLYSAQITAEFTFYERELLFDNIGLSPQRDCQYIMGCHYHNLYNAFDEEIVRSTYSTLTKNPKYKKKVFSPKEYTRRLPQKNHCYLYFIHKTEDGSYMTHAAYQFHPQYLLTKNGFSDHTQTEVLHIDKVFSKYADRFTEVHQFCPNE